MRLLVTGGAGLIGSHVAEAALAAGHEVTIVDDLSTGRRENVPDGAVLHEIDIRDGDAVRKVVAETRPHVVSHQAAQASVAVSVREPVRDAEVNVCVRRRSSASIVSLFSCRFFSFALGGSLGFLGRSFLGLAAGMALAMADFLQTQQRVAFGPSLLVFQHLDALGPSQDVTVSRQSAFHFQ